jgi:DNA-binding transcriptional LysR family regulator
MAMDVHLRDLRYVLAVAQEMSFTRAAERLHIAQPSLSKQIAAVERSLGARLFDRTHRQVALTGAGAALIDGLPGLLDTWDDLQSRVDAAAAADASVLRVGLVTSVGRHLLPATLRAFDQAYPGWRTDLRPTSWEDPTAGLADRSSDVAFVWLPVADPAVESMVLAIEARSVALSVKHRLASRERIDFGELLDERFVALPAPAGPSRDFWLAVEERNGAPVRLAGEASNADAVFEIVASNAGVVLLAAGNAELYRRPDIVCVPVDGLRPARLAVAWRRDDTRSVVRAFVDACAAAAAGSCPAGAAAPGVPLQEDDAQPVRTS